MNQIDRIGTFLGKVTAAAFSVTKKSDLPRLVLTVTTTKKWADTTEELAHYQIAEAGYVDFVDYETTAYLCLYNRDLKESLNYGQIQKVLGWTGQDFADLNGIGVGKEILFRVSENKYIAEDGTDKSGLQVAWIDTTDAPPVSVLQPLAADKTAALTARFLKGKAPSSPPAKAPAKAPAATTARKVATPPVTPTVAAPPKVAAPPVAPKGPPTKTTPVAAPPLPTSGATGLPKECTKLECWNYINSPAVKVDNEDSVLESAFFDAVAEAAPGKQDTELTPAEWAKVRDIVVKDLKV